METKPGTPNVQQQKLKKDIIITIIVILLILLSGKMLRLALDSILLVENTTEMFTLVNSTSQYTDMFIPADHESTVNAYNYFYPLFLDGNFNGINAHTNDDMTFTLSGNNADRDLNIYLGNASLPAGEYIISDGIDDPDIGYIYLWSSTSDPKSNKISSHFTLSDTNANNLLFFHMPAGASTGDKSVTIYPMIRPADVADDTYMPISLKPRAEYYDEEIYDDPERDFVRVRKFCIDRERYAALSSSDKKYLLNYIEYTAPKDG
ncbi:MAG: hypothetical protein K6G42_08285, partial [Lachnospiraceae bacterium]|nr:hypothetical protein [Lachnospiraceae bacterium]